MPQIDTVWPGTSNELHIIVDGNNVQVRSADNNDISRAKWFRASEYPGILSKDVLIFQRGSDLEFIPNVCTGVSGEVYDGIRINNQIWLSTGLRTTMFNDGTNIFRGYSVNNTSPRRYYYYSSTSTSLTHDDSYGMLYNYIVVSESDNHEGVAPAGWDIATWTDYAALTQYLKSNPAFCTDPEDSDEYNNVMKSIASKDLWSSSSTTDAIGNRRYLNNVTGLNIYPQGVKTSANNRETYGTKAHIWIKPDSSSYSYNSVCIANVSVAGYVPEPGYSGSMNGKYIFCVKNLSSPVTLMMGGFGNSNPDNSTDDTIENLENVESDENRSEENIDNATIIEENPGNERESGDPERDENR